MFSGYGVSLEWAQCAGVPCNSTVSSNYDMSVCSMSGAWSGWVWDLQRPGVGGVFAIPVRECWGLVYSVVYAFWGVDPIDLGEVFEGEFSARVIWGV